MWQPSPVPEPPPEAAGVLVELAAYYQELVADHQKAAQSAYVRLMHVEALMGSGKIRSGESVNQEEQREEQTEEGRRKQESIPELVELQVGSEKGAGERESDKWGSAAETGSSTSLTKQNSELTESRLRERRRLARAEEVGSEEKEKSGEGISGEVELAGRAEVELKKSVSLPGENWGEKVRKLLKLNLGKILQIDYIVRELSQNQEPINKQELEAVLTQGEKESWWASVPEAPGCWTLDLKEIAPVGGKGSKKQSQKKKRRKRKNLIPRRGKMKQYQTLTKAVGDCLEQNYPQVCTPQTIVEWLYPEGLLDGERQQVKGSIGKVLSKGAGGDWKRVEVEK